MEKKRTLHLTIKKNGDKFDIEPILEVPSRFSSFTRIPHINQIDEIVIVNPEGMPISIKKPRKKSKPGPEVDKLNKGKEE